MCIMGRIIMIVFFFFKLSSLVCKDTEVGKGRVFASNRRYNRYSTHIQIYTLKCGCFFYGRANYTYKSGHACKQCARNAMHNPFQQTLRTNHNCARFLTTTIIQSSCLQNCKAVTGRQWVLHSGVPVSKGVPFWKRSD